MDSLLIWHIQLAYVVFGLFALAAALAVVLALLEWQLRRHRSVFTWLPSFEQLESGLFFLLSIAFALLTVDLVLAVIALGFNNLARLFEKTVLAIATWFVFGGLLLGRFYFGWRGRRAIYGTLLGFLLLYALHCVSRFYV